jgi:5-methylcytosine-specific restriction endonuclease McrA
MSIRPENRKYYGKAWRKVRDAIVHRRRHKCEICHLGPPDTPPLTVHHRDRDPTNNDPANLLVCCPRHHFQQETLINAGHQYPGQLEISWPYSRARASPPNTATQ